MNGEFKVRFLKLNNDAIVPKFAHPNDAGMDLFANESLVIPSGEAKLVKTGIAMELPPHTEAQIRPRSGLALKRSITVLNSPGTIDEGYRGEIGVILINHGHSAFEVDAGMKIAQMVIKATLQIRVEETNELSDSSRGTGGFGSTGS